ncbi:hypothetical protein B0H14DRAFT_2590399 [Mycena olivaceomarginata]|nr:hypothetical protein B0H14DRAFT_2590399 [Mycena olivaceomarginata]
MPVIVISLVPTVTVFFTWCRCRPRGNCNLPMLEKPMLQTKPRPFPAFKKLFSSQIHPPSIPVSTALILSLISLSPTCPWHQLRNLRRLSSPAAHRTPSRKRNTSELSKFEISNAPADKPVKMKSRPKPKTKVIPQKSVGHSDDGQEQDARCVADVTL